MEEYFRSSDLKELDIYLKFDSSSRDEAGKQNYLMKMSYNDKLP